jgi:hypothetical protein
LLWRYADFVLKKDEICGVQIFTKRPVNEIECDYMLNSDTVIEFLQHYPQALACYLEYLIHTLKVQVWLIVPEAADTSNHHVIICHVMLE